MNRVLQVASIVIAAIEGVEPFEHPRIDPSGSYQDTVVVLQKTARQLSLWEYIEEAPRNLEVLCGVLCSNNFASEFFPPASAYLVLELSEKFLRRVLRQVSANQETLESISPEEELYLEFVRQHCTSRSLFKSTHHSHIGPGPKELKPRDLITAWPGCALIYGVKAWCLLCIHI